MDDRFVELEIRYTHLERQLSELSDVVFSQQKLIDALQRDVTSLRSRMVDLGDPVVNEKPPHY